MVLSSKGRSSDASRKNRIRRARCRKPRKIFKDEVEVTEGVTEHENPGQPFE